MGRCSAVVRVPGVGFAAVAVIPVVGADLVRAVVLHVASALFTVGFEIGG